MQSIRFGAMKIIEMLWKSLFLMTMQKFQLLKLNFCWPVLTIWVVILAHKYYVCVLLFITFHLICNMSMFRDTLNFWFKNSNSNFEGSSLKILGEFWYVIPSASG